MKFVKENMVLVICAAVALLALGAWFWPIGAWRNAWLEKVNADYDQRLSTIKKNQSKPLEIPGTNFKGTGLPTAEWVKAREKANTEISRQAAEVVKASADANTQHRVKMDGKTEVPLLDDKPQPGYLPKIQPGVDPMVYKEEYGAVAGKWRMKLVGTTGPSTPPSDTQLNDEIRLANEAAAARAGGALMQNLVPGNEQRAAQDYRRNGLMKRASEIHMYVDDNAILPRGTWLNSDNPPTDQEIFESLLDSWYKSDVVRAIASVNDEVLNKAKPEAKNVSSSPIKRLMAIRVGNDARGVRLGTFGTQGNNGAAAGSNGSLWMIPQIAITNVDTAVEGDTVSDTADTPPPAAPVTQENTIDPLRSMTGRACGKDYDVVYLQVCMDIDPASVNKFIDALYKQNMGYTLINMRWRTVDPLDRASNGFIYGESQVIEVDMLFEGLLFRNWTLPLMPVGTRNQLQIPLDAQPPQAGQ